MMNDMSCNQQIEASTEAEAQRLAERCAEVMFSNDALTRQLGMQLVRVSPGRAEMTMPVAEWMLNGHRTCHGGMIFSLADSAFAFACNNENETTVAAGCSIDYVSPGRLDDLLTARAEKVWHKGRSGVYDVRVENQQGELIALFRGRSAKIRGTVLGEDAAETTSDSVFNSDTGELSQ